MSNSQTVLSVALFRLKLHYRRNKLVKELEETVRLASSLHTQLKRYSPTLTFINKIDNTNDTYNIDYISFFCLLANRDAPMLIILYDKPVNTFILMPLFSIIYKQLLLKFNLKNYSNSVLYFLNKNATIKKYNQYF